MWKPGAKKKDNMKLKGELYVKRKGKRGGDSGGIRGGG
jgi:hypothetical protein